MSASFEIVTPGMVRIILTYEGKSVDGVPQGIPVDIAREMVEDMALYNWRRGLGPTIEVDGETVQKPFEDLTDQEKLDFAHGAAKRPLIAQAKTARSDTAVDAARADAIAYAEENYYLD